MDFGKTVRYINPAAIKVAVLTDIPFKKSRFTVDDAVKTIPLIVPGITTDVSMAGKEAVVCFKQELNLEPIRISSPENFYSFSFNLLTKKLSTETINLTNMENFTAALSNVYQIFSSAWNFISKMPQTAIDIMNDVSTFCQSVPLKKIAKGIGAQSYSITLILIPSITFNFETEQN
jgi:hypothetical protein